MDQRLIPADPGVVRRLIAQAYLASPIIALEQGEIRLAPHQVDAASRVFALLNQWGGAVLADATGLGKTFVAVAVARLHAPAMVVAPAALRGMWRESLGRAGVEAGVESYEGLSRDRVPDGRPRLLILDEAHHARTPSTRRYARLADLAWGAKVLLLTATPVHNRNRDLRTLVALFLGSRADTMTDDELLRLIVRRTTSGDGTALPVINVPNWITVPSDPDTLAAIVALPPAAPIADGAPAHALMLLGLIRAWSSSEAALRGMLRRRLRRAASLGAALESGRRPSRHELASWPVVGDAIQLGFAGLFGAPDEGRVDIQRIRATLDEHVEGVRAILRHLDRVDSSADHARVHAVRSIMERTPSVPAVAFTQFVDTASAMFRSCAPDGGVALVTGKGARVASGQVSVDEIVRGFDVAPDESTRNAAMPLQLLIASDVLSEGLSLRRAGVLIHLDLPWTMARLEQRVGRLRRIGSAHAVINVFAIGPPVSARELVPVVRALQRKARLSNAIVGRSELASSMPLFGERLTRAISTVRDPDAHERLRAALRRWLDEPNPASSDQPAYAATEAGLAVVVSGGVQRLIAIEGSIVTEDPACVLRAVGALSRCQLPVLPAPDATGILSPISQWMEEQRGRDLAHLATDSPSPAHTDALRMLNDRWQCATRTERATLGPRIECCRMMVLRVRGIGAERALLQLSQHALDLDALERILESRNPTQSAAVEPRLLALLSASEAGICAWMRE